MDGVWDGESPCWIGHEEAEENMVGMGVVTAQPAAAVAQLER